MMTSPLITDDLRKSHIRAGIGFTQYLTAGLIRRRQLFKDGEGVMQHALLLSILIFNATFGLIGHVLGML